MTVKCFLIEPVYDPLTKVLKYDREKTPGTGYPVMRRVDTGEEGLWGDTPGAMWFDYDSVWSEEHQDHQYAGLTAKSYTPDGHSLVVIMPNGHHWYIDSIAGNCPEKDRPHACWSRSGTPPEVSVGKGACKCDGAGSIRSWHYHGHLQNGSFTDPLGDSNDPPYA